MKVEPCPENCTFDWITFHRELDYAVAHMIQEIDGTLPSKTSLLAFMSFSNAKVDGQVARAKETDERDRL